MKRVLILVCFAATAIISVLLYVISFKTEFNVTEEWELLEQQKVAGIYEMVDDNIIKCDLVTFSSIVSNMYEDGYELVSEKHIGMECDIILKKSDTYIRMYYDSSGVLTSICNSYEKSYIPLTYIIEEE